MTTDESIFGKAEFIDTSDENVTEEELAKRYDAAWRRLERVVFQAKQLHFSLTGSDLLPTTPQHGASLLFFKKMVRHGSSMLKICPEPIGSVGDYDRDSAAAIARVIYENYLVLFYACLEKVSKGEWDARNTLLGLRSSVAGKQILEASSDKLPSDRLTKSIDEARERLKRNSFFRAMPKARQEHFLLGHKAMFHSYEEIGTRLGNEKQKTVATYKILSNSVHSTPSAFRMHPSENWSDGELQFDLELSALAMTFGAYYLNRATIQLKHLEPRWSKYLSQGFEIHKKLEERDERSAQLSRERRAARRSRGEWP
jgi:hypothetical protein